MIESKLLKDTQHFSSILLQNIPGMVYRCKTNSNRSIESVQGLCEEITGFTAAELLNTNITISHLVKESQREKYMRKWLNCLNNQATFQEEYAINTKNGTEKWVSEQGVGIYDETGKAVAIEGFITDVTEHRLSDLALYTEKERLRITLQSIGDGVITTDNQGKITMLNKVAEEITGWSQRCAQGKDFDQVFNIYDADTKQKSNSPIDQVLQTGKVVELAQNTILLAQDGTKRYISDSAAPIKDSLGNIFGIVVVFRDVTKERIQESKIRYATYHDVLTGLHNRLYFEETLSSFNNKASLPLTIIYGDLNGLKLTNDVFGHEHGDQLLINTGQILKKCSGQAGIVSRYGGDEFTILLPNTTEKQAELICEDIKLAGQQAYHKPVAISLALGYATKKKDSDNIYDILKKAEESMYSNKLVESKRFQAAIITSLTELLSNKSSETVEHSYRMTRLALALGKAFGLSEPRLKEVKLLADLHDIGNIGIKNSILGKPGALTPEEWVEIKKHPQTGFRIAQTSSELVQIAEGILAHQERWDGQGYPQGLAARDIPLISRIIAIVDAYEAMTGYRVYKESISHEAAMGEIQDNSGLQFDPYLVKLFVKIMEEQPDLRII